MQTADPASPQEAARRALIAIVRERSYRYGTEITLASGRKSLFYFNMKPTMLHPEGSRLIATLVLEAIAPLQADYIGGLEMGAVPLAAAAAAVSASTERPITAFFVRKQAKEHGTRSLIEGLASGETLAGKRVVIIEDVTTTGGSAIKAADIVRAESATVVAVVTVLDRQEGADEAFAAAGLPFIPILRRGDFSAG
ncbi:MAG: orotate phosphoribosyltransferase [Hyphomicrobiaceae bacterium]|nr:orotate phosphoribosyltransferase [Hyphomicrobiaceae bacterium]